MGPAPSLQMQNKMMAYDRVVSRLNASRLQGTSFPIVHGLIEASLAVNPDVSATTLSVAHAPMLRPVPSHETCK